MIKFSASEDQIPDSVHSYFQLLAENLAAILNQKGTDVECAEHPDALTIVDVITYPKLDLKIHLCCCISFEVAVRAWLAASVACDVDRGLQA